MYGVRNIVTTTVYVRRPLYIYDISIYCATKTLSPTHTKMLSFYVTCNKIIVGLVQPERSLEARGGGIRRFFS